MAKKKSTDTENLITLTDQEGSEHEFHLLDIFSVGKKNFALLHPTNGEKNEATILKLTLGRDGSIKKFEDPSDAEFESAVKELESADGCSGECCGGESECCGGEETKAVKAKAKKPAAKKATAKKPAAKKVAAKKPAAKKAAKKSKRAA